MKSEDSKCFSRNDQRRTEFPVFLRALCCGRPFLTLSRRNLVLIYHTETTDTTKSKAFNFEFLLLPFPISLASDSLNYCHS